MIYKKSQHGAEALAARDRALTPRLRSLLIMLDGKRTTSELSQLTMQEDVAPLIDRLLELGMVEEAGPAPPPAAAHPTSAPAPLAPAGPTIPLADAQRFVVRRLTDMLGPTAQDLCMKIESTRTAADFMTVMHKVEEMVRQVKGEQAARAFTEEVESHRPA